MSITTGLTEPSGFAEAVRRFVDTVQHPDAPTEAATIAAAFSAVDGPLTAREDLLIRSVFPDATNITATTPTWAAAWLSEPSPLFRTLLDAGT